MDPDFRQRFGDTKVGDNSHVFQGIQYNNAPLPSALERRRFRHGNPPPLNKHFLGREREIAAIKRAFRKGNIHQQSRYVIYGMGGIGKSEICVKLFNDMQDEFWGMFWVDVSDVASAEADFKGIADQIHPGTTHQTLEDALSVLAELDINAHPWLLILDNADELRVDYARFLPYTSGGAIIMTSRNRECIEHETVGHQELDSIRSEDAILLLFRASRLPRHQWEHYKPQAKIVAELLGSHTLALIQAGAYLSQNAQNWHEYPIVFEQNRQYLLKIRTKQAKSRHGDIYATFEVSASALESHGGTEAKDALCLLSVLAMFHHSGFPTSVLHDARKALVSCPKHVYSDRVNWASVALAELAPESLSDRKKSQLRLQGALNCLESLCFVKQTGKETTDGTNLVSMHPLAHAWAKDRLDPKDQERAWVMTGSIITHSVITVEKGRGFGDYSKWVSLGLQMQSHVNSFLENRRFCTSAGTGEISNMQIDYGIASILAWMGLDERGKLFLLEVIVGLGGTPERPVNIIFAPFYQGLADSFQHLGLYSKSEDLYRRLILLQKSNGVSENGLLVLYQKLAAVLHLNGQTREARELLQYVVNMQQEIYEEDHLYLLASKFTLAQVFSSEYRLQAALGLFQHVLRIAEKSLRPNYPTLLLVRDGTAVAHLRNWQWREAIGLVDNVVQIETKMYSAASNNLVNSQGVLAETLLIDGRVREAIKLLEKIVLIVKNRPEAYKKSLSELQSTLGIAYLRNGQGGEAIKLLELVIRTEKKERTEDDQILLHQRYELAHAYNLEGRRSSALNLFDHIARVGRSGKIEYNTCDILLWSWLPKRYIEDGRLEEAKKVIRDFNRTMQHLGTEDHRRQVYEGWLEQWISDIRLVEIEMGVKVQEKDHSLALRRPEDRTERRKRKRRRRKTEIPQTQRDRQKNNSKKSLMRWLCLS